MAMSEGIIFRPSTMNLKMAADVLLAGEAVDVDEEGRLVVRTDSGEVHVFTGEVSVHGLSLIHIWCRW